jgi:hypothetical protein
MKTHLITILILALCVVMIISKYVFFGVIGLGLIVFAYGCVYLIVSRIMAGKKFPKN